MKYFIDTEFIEGSQTKRLLSIPIGKTRPTIDLISIGIVCEDGREYYAISKDFNLKEAWNRWQQRTGEGDRNNIEPKEYWLRDNVCRNLFNNETFKFYDSIDTYKEFKNLVKHFGKSNAQIAEEIKEFTHLIHSRLLPDGHRSKPEFYGYYADYDWVVFCWLFGKMIDLPKGFPMYCNDLKQESDRIYNLKKEEYTKGGGRNFINEMSNHLDYPKQTNEHNALADAKWNKRLYEFLINVIS